MSPAICGIVGPAETVPRADSTTWPCLRPRSNVWLGGVPGKVVRREHGLCQIERADGRHAMVILVEHQDDPTPHIPKVQSIEFLGEAVSSS